MVYRLQQLQVRSSGLLKIMMGMIEKKLMGGHDFMQQHKKTDENVTTWQMRLIGLISDADPGNTFKEHRDKFLITTFWSNLCNKDLKIATAYMRKSATTFLDFLGQSRVRNHPMSKSMMQNPLNQTITYNQTELCRTTN